MTICDGSQLDEADFPPGELRGIVNISRPGAIGLAAISHAKWRASDPSVVVERIAKIRSIRGFGWYTNSFVGHCHSWRPLNSATLTSPEEILCLLPRLSAAP